MHDEDDRVGAVIAGDNDPLFDTIDPDEAGVIYRFSLG